MQMLHMLLHVALAFPADVIINLIGSASAIHSRDAVFYLSLQLVNARSPLGSR